MTNPTANQPSSAVDELRAVTTVEQAVVVLNERQWRGRDNWHIDSGLILSGSPHPKAVYYLARTEIPDAIAIANSLVMGAIIAAQEQRLGELERELELRKSAWIEVSRLREAVRSAFPHIRGDGCDAPAILAQGIKQQEQRLEDLECLRSAAAQSWAEASNEKLRLESLIGQPPEGSHPDEWKPRAETWHQERANWLDQVERQANFIKQQEQRIGELEAQLADAVLAMDAAEAAGRPEHESLQDSIEYFVLQWQIAQEKMIELEAKLAALTV